MMKALFTLSVLPLSVLSAWAPPGPDGKYTLTAPGITAKFIPYAACITNLIVADRNGTLHSGLNGWSHRVWNVSDVTATSITFTIRDESNSSMGFPGLVLGTVTYSASNDTWSTKLSAVAVDHDTQLMLTTHPYWNLDAFSNPKTDLILNHTLSLPFSTRMLGIDPATECTGAIPAVPKGSINDPNWVGNCGTGSGCSGYNNQWVIDRNASDSAKPVATLSSDYTGIKWDLYTDQAGVVVYSCFWMGG
jgi:aldose 1-epimerase